MAVAARTCGECHQAVEPRKPPRVPRGLGSAGRELWRDVTGTYALDPHELHTLREACRTADEMERVRAEMDAAPSLLAKGSMGQAVEHPLLGTLRGHRATHDKLMARLRLPDMYGNVAPTAGQLRSVAASDARWGAHRAAKAEREAVVASAEKAARDRMKKAGERGA
jgi:hypothetical protein